MAQTTSISTVLVISGQALAPAQKLFNQLLAKIDSNKQALQNLLMWSTEHRVQYAKRMSPLEQQIQALEKQMVLLLDQRLQNKKGLSKSIRAYMQEVLCGLAGSLMHNSGHADMASIYERHAGLRPAGSEMDCAAAMHATDAYGFDRDDLELNQPYESPEQAMAAALRMMQEKIEAQASLDAAKNAMRKKTAKQLKDERETLDADKVLRDIYRKLASALHPDKEPEQKERARKTALMVEVNVANEKKDLLALLQLQLKIEQIDPGAVSAMAHDKLRHFNRILKAQVLSLKRELAHAQYMVQTEFNLSYGAITPESLARSLQRSEHEIQTLMGQMTHDLQQVQHDSGLKAWVKAQKAAADHQRYDFDELVELDDLDGDQFEIFRAVLAKAARNR